MSYPSLNQLSDQKESQPYLLLELHIIHCLSSFLKYVKPSLESTAMKSLIPIWFQTNGTMLRKDFQRDGIFHTYVVPLMENT